MIDKFASSLPATGEQETEQTITKIYPFDKFEIEVKLSETGKFIGITAIKMNADFLNYKQKLVAAENFHDAMEYYDEEE